MMKSSGRRKRKALEILHENREQTGAKEKKSSNTNCRHSRSAPCEGESCLLEKDQKVKLSCAAELSRQCKSLPNMATVPPMNIQTAGILSSAKMKLQLFPVNETTRLRLEKDGHNPFLELTLSARKKISSVIKHLNNKWGSSSAAIEELMLFPYNMRLENFSASRRWTADNGGITIGELHEVLQSPAVFRLRYGWFPNLQSGVSGGFYASIGAPFESENIGKACNSFSSIASCLTEELKVDSQEIRSSFDVNKARGVVASTEQSLVAMPADQEENVVPSVPAQSIVSWDDSFTGLSIGGLLSEASLLNKISNSNLESDMRSGLQPIFFSDISIGGLLHEASLQEKIKNPEVQSENKLALQPKESVTDMGSGGLFSKVSFQDQTGNPDMDTQTEAKLHSIQLTSEISTGHLLSEASLQCKNNPHDTTFDGKTLGLQPLRETGVAQSPWDDSLTTLSIGGLLSEASLQAKIANSDPKSAGTMSNSQSRIPNFDSFDAFLSAQFNSQLQTSNTSLLDFHAEDTCHAFPFQELSSFSKGSRGPHEREKSRGYFENTQIASERQG